LRHAAVKLVSMLLFSVEVKAIPPRPLELWRCVSRAPHAGHIITRQSHRRWAGSA
jgi:hypothetical protein